MMNPFKILKIKTIYPLLLVTFAVHWVAASLAMSAMVGDEQFYVPSSIDAVHLVASNFEHPPLVKVIVGLFISGLGNNWVGWRLAIVLFSVLATWLTYKIALEFLSERASTFATALTGLSIIFLFMGSTVMLDIPCIAFGLAGLYSALRGRYVWSGLMFGLSFLCKELAVLMFGATFLFLVVKKVGGWRILFHSMLAFSVGFFGIWIYDLIYKPVVQGVALSNPIEHFYFMIKYQITLNGSRAPIPARWYPPISWVSPFGHNALNPMGFIAWKITGTSKIIALWVLQPNIAIEYFMLPLLILLPILYWKRKSILAFLSWVWLALCYLPWFFAGFFVKTEGNFYIVYSVPFLCIGSVYLWTLISNKRLKYALATTQFIVGLAFFIYYMVIFPIVIK